MPATSGPVPIVVLVPGGSWTAADPAGLLPLARALSAAGYVAATTTYRTADEHAYFPIPVEDVLCAAAHAATVAARAGHGGGPVILVGHSAGAPLAVLAALRPGSFRGGCTDPPVTPSGAVGLAGAYDLPALGGVADSLMGAPQQTAPGRWREADVFRWVDARPVLPLLLVHGAADDLVPPAVTRRLGDALTGAGHRVRVEMVAGAGHQDVYRPAVVATLMLDWLRMTFGPGRAHR